jgi:1,2-dihydroxy-3-keto-5-methylthiopentene dioxygenase
MTTLSIYPDNDSTECETYTDYETIVAKLKEVGVQFERWEARKVLPPDADQDQILAAYMEDVERLNKQYGFQSVDVVSLRPDNPKKGEMRQKFLNEHTHDDFEVRFFVDGQGLFYLHIGNKVYTILCTSGDLISVPANTMHWFDMGENPDFKCIRFFTTEDGWAGNFTGSDISQRYPDFDDYIRSLN